MDVKEELWEVAKEIERAEACLGMGYEEEARAREDAAVVRLVRVVEEVKYGKGVTRLSEAWRRLMS